jgi:hypothetical protein
VAVVGPQNLQSELRAQPGRWRKLFPPEVAIALIVVTAVHALATPRSHWEFDEPLFARALEKYDPWQHHPPPPGYPVYVALGKILYFILGDPFPALVALSFAAVIVGFFAFAHSFSDIAGDLRAGVIGAALFYLSPTMLIHGTVPQSDSPALAFLSLTLLSATRKQWIAFGVLAGLTVGLRPQFAIVVLPLLLATLVLITGWRGRAVTLAAFTASCLLWLIPFALILGGPGRLIEFEAGQAAYYAAHDAEISRGGWTAVKIAGRFIARPWGPVWLAALFFLCAVAGFIHLVRRRPREFGPLAVAGLIYLAFALWSMDPADGARYALPSVVPVALAAGTGVAMVLRARAAAYGLAAVLALLSVGYTSPLLLARATEPSPPEQARRWIVENVPRNAVLLVELPLWPHATYWFRDHNLLRIDEGLPRFVDRPDVPLFIFADGASDEDGSAVFRWPASHVYEKLTRNHYRVVSVIPVTPGDRFHAGGGVYGSERDEREGWRWLGPQAQLVLPDVDASRAVFRFALTPTTPYESTRVELILNGRLAAAAVVRRGRESEVALPIPDGEIAVSIRTERSFVPGAGGSGDPRRLAVRLIDIDQR